MSSLSKTISLVAAAAAVAGGPTTVGAQTLRGGEPHPPLPHHRSDDRALRSDANANATAFANATAPEVASIVNGEPTGGPRSYMVGLTHKRYGFPYYWINCGGTLIAPSVVLTAAHCMYTNPGGSWDPVDQVLVNLYDVNKPAGVAAINIEDPSEGADIEDPSEGADIVVHPDYGGIKKPVNDIALMFLPVGQVADYAQINDNPNEPADPELDDFGDPLRVMGWGSITHFGVTPSDELLETTVDYISNEECKKVYNAEYTENYGYEFTDGMMCGYQNYTGICKGDSGGPLFHVDKDGEIGGRPTQVGIVSWSPVCAFPEYPGVYTRVSYYSEWIKDTVCSRPKHATKELCGSFKSSKSAKSSYAP